MPFLNQAKIYLPKEVLIGEGAVFKHLSQGVAYCFILIIKDNTQKQ